MLHLLNSFITHFLIVLTKFIYQKNHRSPQKLFKRYSKSSQCLQKVLKRYSKSPQIPQIPQRVLKRYSSPQKVLKKPSKGNQKVIKEDQKVSKFSINTLERKKRKA